MPHFWHPAFLFLRACVVGSLPSTPPRSMSTLDNSHQSRNWYYPLPLGGTSLEQCVHPPSRVCCLGLHLSRQTNELGLISGIYIQGNQTWLIFRSNTRLEVWVRTLLLSFISIHNSITLLKSVMTLLPSFGSTDH